MTEKEILDKVLFGYDVKVPDILQSLDLDKVEMEEVKPMSVKKKYVSAALIYAAACFVVICLIPFIIGGGDDPEVPPPSDLGTAVSTGDAETELVHDFGGDKFKFLQIGREKQLSRNTYTQPFARDVYLNACDWSTEIMNEAVAKRNEAVERDCNVELVFETAKDIVGEAKKRIMAGQCDFNVILGEGNSVSSLATDPHYNAMYDFSFEGYLLDYHSVDGIDLTQSYWMPDTVDDLSVNGKMFLGGGMITMDPIAHADMLYFNKALMNELEIEYPYSLVDEGKWTYGKFIDMLLESEKDLDGDGVVTDSDRWSGIHESDLISIIAESAPSTRVLDDGTYEIVPYTDLTRRTYDEYKDTIELLYSAEQYWGDVWESYYETTSFKETRALFLKGNLDYSRRLDNMSSGYGIVPLPVLEEGEEYVSHGSGNSNMLAIPKDNPNTEMTGAVLEYMAKVSEEILLPAYVEETLGSAKVQDERNYEMFDIIKNSISYDWTEMYLWGGSYDYVGYTDMRIGLMTRGYGENTVKRLNEVLTHFE